MRWALLLALLLGPQSNAHELQENRATLVLRDKSHIAITLYIAYSDALHRALLPQRPFGSFLAIYSAMKPEDLQKELLRAQAKFEASIHMYLSPGPGRQIAIRSWIWPDAKQVQSMLQQRMMAAMVDPGGHAHDQPLEIHADAVAPADVGGLTIRFPEEFEKVLVVSYRPNQVWVEKKTLSREIRF